MGLKTRKIRAMLSEHAATCVQDLNRKLGTSFIYDIDWTAIPEEIDGWNWDDADLRVCLYNSYFHPIESGMTTLFEDPMYREEIIKQVRSIRIEPGRSMVADFDFNDGVLILKNSLCANQRTQSSVYSQSAIDDLTRIINSKLT